jgi:hypothetical protein
MPLLLLNTVPAARSRDGIDESSALYSNSPVCENRGMDRNNETNANTNFFITFALLLFIHQELEIP